LGLTGKGEGFSLRFALTSDFASDLTTMLGTRQKAQIGWDALDQIYCDKELNAEIKLNSPIGRRRCPLK